MMADVEGVAGPDATHADGGRVHLDRRLERHHLVSRGYQHNFATADRRLDVIDPRTGDVVQRLRAVKNNYVTRGFNAFVDDTGEVNSELEDAFSRVETAVLPTVRELNAKRVSADIKADVANLFAIHLVRSEAYKSFAEWIHNEAGPELIRNAIDDELRGRFRSERGRLPRPGELELLTQELLHSRREEYRIGGMARHHDWIAAYLNSLHLQVVELGPDVCGLVLGDVPVVHAHTPTKQFGFADRLAIRAANVVVGPVTRRVAALFTSQTEAHVAVRSQKAASSLNALLIRGASREVACHPDDTMRVRRICWHLDRELARQL